MAKTQKKSARGQTGREEAPSDEQIRERMRELTSKMLRGEQIDPRGVEDVVRTMAGGRDQAPEEAPPEARQALLDALESLDDALMRSAESAHAVLQQIRSKGSDFSDNDLKEAHAKLSELQDAYVETVNRLAGAASGNLRHELSRLAGHARRVGLDTGARTASMMTELANRFADVSQKGAATGIDMTREYGMRMSLMASGFLAGIADALGEQRGTRREEE